MTGLLFCFYSKLLLLSNLNSVDVGSSISRIVLNFEPADKNFTKELGVFVDGKFQGHPFRSLKKYKLTKQLFWCTRNMHFIVRKCGCLDYSELPNMLLRNVKSENFAKGAEKCKVLGNFLDKEMVNMDDQSCPKIRHPGDPKAGEEVWVCLSYPFRHKKTHSIVQSGRQKCLVRGQGVIWSCKFYY